MRIVTRTVIILVTIDVVATSVGLVVVTAGFKGYLPQNDLLRSIRVLAG